MKTISDKELKRRSILLMDYYTKESETFFPSKKFILLKQKELELQIKNLIRNEEYKFSLRETLFIILGQGGFELFKRMHSEHILYDRGIVLFIHAKRVYENITIKGRETYSVRATVGQIDISPKVAHEIRRIVVIDDVISSGITLRTLYKKNAGEFFNASWEAIVLLSKQEKVKSYKSIFAPVFIENQLTQVNTFSKFTEDEMTRKEFLEKNFTKEESDMEMANRHFTELKVKCLHTPHVFCFDLYNTLIEEDAQIPSYIDYLSDIASSHTYKKEDIYEFVKNKIMNHEYPSFKLMAEKVGKEFGLSKEEIKEVEKRWETGSSNTKWIEKDFLSKLKKLKELGHKLVLITNCTYPAWKIVSDQYPFEKYFDRCFISSMQGISKPNIKVFLNIEGWFDYSPRNKFVMIGDNPQDDLAIPIKRGWQVYDENFLHQFVL